MKPPTSTPLAFIMAVLPSVPTHLPLIHSIFRQTDFFIQVGDNISWTETDEAEMWFFFSVHCLNLFCSVHPFTRPPQTRHPPGWSGSNAARTSPCQTPPPWASHAGCSSSGTSWWDTSGTCKCSGGLTLRSLDLFRFFPLSEYSPLGELLLRRDVDFVLHAANLHNVSQVSRLSIHLDPLFEEKLLLVIAQ